jgi:hypothetical protein
MQRLREEQITPGVIVVYTLRADQRPRHPEKEWHGKVIRYYRDFHRAMVVSLEEGYEGCEEDVWLEQVVRIEQLCFKDAVRAFPLFGLWLYSAQQAV